MLNSLKNSFLRIFFRNNKSYENASIVSEVYKVIIVCSRCGQKLKVPVFEDKKLRITCSKCKHKFLFNCKRYRLKEKIISHIKIGACIVLLLLDIVTPIYLFPKTNTIMINLNSKYVGKISEKKLEFLKENKELQDRYTEEVKRINPSQLKIIADEYYAKIWEDRINFSSKYAITPREKAQLEMMALSQDKSKNIKDIIKGIAIMAAPKNSTINVYSAGNGYSLDIDFDMSELSIGEKGTKTKHNSIDSLKKDVNRLISKVTNDVYQFCQTLDLESIHIGCRHYVMQYDENKISKGDTNTVLYKICLEKKDLSELKDNPFLDIYSTTKYLKVEVNDFPNIEISVDQQ